MNKDNVHPLASPPLAPRIGGVALVRLELALGMVVLALVLAALVVTIGLPGLSVMWAAIVYAGLAVLLLSHWPDPGQSLGVANRITLGRALLVAVLAGAVAGFPALAPHTGLLALLALLALALDGVDGWAARRWQCESAFGARFDMELDAFLILVLCALLWVLDKAGLWVFAIGAMRYLFVLTMRPWPWLAAPLPPSLRRKSVCVWQVGSLLLCLLPGVRGSFALVLLGTALALLVWSFALDVRWLQRQHAVSTVGSFP